MSTAVDGPREVRDPVLLDRIARIRFEVWNARGLLVPEAFPERAWRDPIDARARHFACFVGGELAGAIRYAVLDTLDEHPEAAHLRKIGVALDGPIGLPERLVVRPGYRALRLPERFADHLLRCAIADGARWILTEATPPMVAMLQARGRRHLGPSAPDPRFPTMDFQLMLTDVRAARFAGEGVAPDA